VPQLSKAQHVIEFMRLRDKISNNLKIATEDQVYSLPFQEKQRVIAIREAQSKASKQLLTLKAALQVQKKQKETDQEMKKRSQNI
jgi:hypothetical protein